MVTTVDRRETSDDTVIISVKTPMMPRPTTARFPGRLSLRESIRQLTSEQPKNAHAARVINQLLREQSEVHHFLAVKPTGVEQVDPERTTLGDIAVPKEVRTDQGIDHVRVASVEIQAYARVGV